MKHPLTIDRRGFLKASVALTATAMLPSCAETGVRPTSKPGYQLGCYTRPWDEYEYRVALDGMAEAGFKYAGIMTQKRVKSWVIITTEVTPEEAAKIGDEVKKRGMKTLSVYGDFSLGQSPETNIQKLRRLIDNCVACESPNLLLGGTGDAKLVEPYYKTIAECCDYTAEKGIQLQIKPHGGQNATGPQCRKVIESVKHKNFGLWYDPGNIFYYSDGKLDPVDDAPSVSGLVMGVSVKDFRLPKEVQVTPGTGLVNFPRVLALLKKGGFDHGPLVIECLDKGDAAKVTAEARKARLFLEDVLAKL